MKQARKRYDEVTRMFDMLYVDSRSGHISNDNFTHLVDEHQAKQASFWNRSMRWNWSCRRSRTFDRTR